MLHSIFLSCNGPELGPASAASQCTGSVPVSVSPHPASASGHAAGDVSGVAGSQCTDYCCPGGDSSGDPCHHHRLSVQHICGSTSDRRALHQPGYRKKSPPLFVLLLLLHMLYEHIVIIYIFLKFWSDQCCFFGSATAVPQLPYVHSHHQQCHVRHGWNHQSDHHKCPGTGGCHQGLLL